MRARRWLLLLLLAATRLWAAEPAIEFAGVLAAGSETKVSLTDKTSGASRWVRVGQEFVGYVVSFYDAKAEAIVLTKGGQQFRVPLKSSAKVKAGAAAEPSPEIKKGIMNYLRQLAAAADQFYLMHGVSHVTFDELVGPEKYVKKVEPLDGEDYRQIVFAQGKPMTVTTAGGYTMSYNP